MSSTDSLARGPSRPGDQAAWRPALWVAAALAGGLTELRGLGRPELLAELGLGPLRRAAWLAGALERAPARVLLATAGRLVGAPHEPARSGRLDPEEAGRPGAGQHPAAR